MKLSLYRTQYLPGCTKGNLYVDGSLECFTIEPPLKFNGALDVPDKTCVPEGEYSVSRFMSAHMDMMVALVGGVPNRDNIEIHPGNEPHETQGCIIVGATWCNGPEVANSRMAFNALMGKWMNAWAARELVTLEIQSVFEVRNVSANS